MVVGHAGFIKSVEDIYEAMINSAPSVRFGVAFTEASGPCLVRGEGNDPKMEALAKKNAMAIGAGHTFVVLFIGAYPINVINAIKSVVEVSVVFAQLRIRPKCLLPKPASEKLSWGWWTEIARKGLKGKGRRQKGRYSCGRPDTNSEAVL